MINIERAPMDYVHLVEQLTISLDQKLHIKIIHRVNLFTVGSYQKFWASVSFDSELYKLMSRYNLIQMCWHFFPKNLVVSIFSCPGQLNR